jgi:hypothetical protein
MKKWDDSFWNASLKTAIFLYVEANQAAGGAEGAIVLAQAALELLASLHSICYLNDTPCKNIFENIDADERIRWLLEDLSIPVEIDQKTHTDLSDLRNYCGEALKNEKYKDGPKAITLHRNAIIHPYKRKIDNILNKTNDKVKLEILDLAIWYIEMVLLRLFEYNGQYANRLWRFRENRTGSDFSQQVPWNGPLSPHCINCPMPRPDLTKR